MKELIFYHSFLCPRCRLSRKMLIKVLDRHPEVRLREMDVTRHPLVAIRDGIRLFPACRLGKKRLSGIILNEKKLEEFIAESDGMDR